MSFFWGHSFIKFFSLNNLQISNWFTGGLKKLNLKGKTVKKWELSVLLRTKGRLSLPQRQPLITQMRKNYECPYFKTKSPSVMMLHRFFMCLFNFLSMEEDSHGAAFYPATYKYWYHSGVVREVLYLFYYTS